MSSFQRSLKHKICDPVFTDNNLDQKYECPECNYLLEDAVQISCGHWLCQDCARIFFERSPNPVCPHHDCGKRLEIEDGKKYFSDKAVQRKIHMLQTRCRNFDVCVWAGTYIELLKHLETCIYEPQECPHCSEIIMTSKFRSHKKNCPKAIVTCPFVQYGCEVTKQMTKAECDEHLEAEVAKHLKFLVASLSTVIMFGSCRPTKDELYDPPNQENPLETDNQTFKPFSSPSGQPSGKVEADRHELTKEIAAKESQICHLQCKLQQLEATIFMNESKNVEDRDFRLSLMENSNYDGTMVWKIPQFSQRMEDARTGKYISLFSLPFYSGHCGYKMCLRLYILGDGIGKGSHMSLFFVLMKGEFDNILQWPFTHKVAFKLINQCEGRDVVDIFQPDPLSSSFQKPKTDMNIASGCPRFVPLNELMQNGFIVEDTIFIKVKVDTTTIELP